jgi:2-oxoglutarate ferredoxin oxidoreductase subunit beta
MEGPNFPVAIGVLYCNPSNTYEDAVHAQISAEKKAHPSTNINDLLRSGPTWTVD